MIFFCVLLSVIYEFFTSRYVDIRQAHISEKRFLSARRGANLQPSDEWLDTLTIEIPRLRWETEVHGGHIISVSWQAHMQRICPAYILNRHLSSL